MQLSKIRIRNYRLLIDTELDVDFQTILIVGRNNTAKTSCIECISTVLSGKAFSYNDYPLDKRNDFYNKLERFMKKEISFDEFAEQLEKISIDFWVDYSLDDPESVLGALSPFIIDVDVETTTALICAVNKLKRDEKDLRNLLENCYYKDGSFSPKNEDIYDIISSMSEDQKGINYKHAKVEADKVDAQIIEALQAGHSFRVEAGAGSGKTYSLNRVIEWIQANKWTEYSKKKQSVVCITYTNAAVDVIAERLSTDSFILPTTIHSFAWNAIRQYQGFLVDAVANDSDFVTDEGDCFEVTEVSYMLGHRYKKNGIQYPYHDDVLKLFCRLLDNAKFRRVFADTYPLILVDEYQDSYGPIIKRFIKFYIAEGKKPQFGFFGDSWQTIYQTNKACGTIEHDSLDVIKKGSNFRSAPKIVKLLNYIRPELPQTSAIDDFEGRVLVITCDDYTGSRRTDRNFKSDLPPEELKVRLSKIAEKIEQETTPEEKLKILMITHKVLATQQGYERLLEILNDGLRDKEDPFLLFFMNTIEPIYHALNTSNLQLLFEVLGNKRYPITKKSEKSKWKNLQEQLCEARKKRAIDVYEVINQTKLIPIPPKLEDWYHRYHNAPDSMYTSDTSVQSFLNLNYEQFTAAIDFLYPESLFSTEHGVKGEEYDNVVFVIGKGWNQYQFETYAPMITGFSSIPNDKQDSFERNRNLFYVCCSRSKKRLILFVSILIDTTFRNFLSALVGTDNIFTYAQFIKGTNLLN